MSLQLLADVLFNLARALGLLSDGAEQFRIPEQRLLRLGAQRAECLCMYRLVRLVPGNQPVLVVEDGKRRGGHLNTLEEQGMLAPNAFDTFCHWAPPPCRRDGGLRLGLLIARLPVERPDQDRPAPLIFASLLLTLLVLPWPNATSTSPARRPRSSASFLPGALSAGDERASNSVRPTLGSPGVENSVTPGPPANVSGLNRLKIGNTIISATPFIGSVANALLRCNTQRVDAYENVSFIPCFVRLAPSPEW
jgi:hypothetical protein